MLDQEFVNRFLVFYLMNHADIDRDMDKSMDAALKIAAALSAHERADCARRFDNAMRLSFALFGRQAFRKWKQGTERRRPLNKALFDVGAVRLARLNDADAQILLARKDVFIARCKELINDPKFIDAVTTFTSDPRRVAARYKKMRAAILETLEYSA